MPAGAGSSLWEPIPYLDLTIGYALPDGVSVHHDFDGWTIITYRYGDWAARDKFYSKYVKPEEAERIGHYIIEKMKRDLDKQIRIGRIPREVN